MKIIRATTPNRKACQSDRAFWYIGTKKTGGMASVRSIQSMQRQSGKVAGTDMG
jgi:hypothetical protein